MTQPNGARSYLLVLLLGLAWLAAVPSTADANFVGSQTLTFEDYGEGTPITTQYEAEGIIFSGASPDEPPFIAWDTASSTNPVLSGDPRFHGPIHGEFVSPGTPLPTTVDGLAMEVGYIDDPGSVQLSVITTTGTETITADQYGFNYLESNAPNIIGFSVEETGFDSEGFEIDNVSFTPGAPPTPPPPPPPAPAPTPAPAPAINPCIISHGSLAHNLLASIKCTAHLTALEIVCGIKIALLVYVPFKDLKLIEAAKASSVIKTLPAKYRPAAKFLYDLTHAKYSKNAPRGFANGAEAVKTVLRLKKASDLIKVLPDLAKAIPKLAFSQIALDLDDILGLKSCVQAVADGSAG